MYRLAALVLLVGCNSPKDPSGDDTDQGSDTDTTVASQDTDPGATDTDASASDTDASDTDPLPGDTDVVIPTVADLAGTWTRTNVNGSDCSASLDTSAVGIVLTDATTFQLTMSGRTVSCTASAATADGLPFGCEGSEFGANITDSSPQGYCHATFVVSSSGVAASGAISFHIHTMRNGQGMCGTCNGDIQLDTVHAQ